MLDHSRLAGLLFDYTTSATIILLTTSIEERADYGGSLAVNLKPKFFTLRGWAPAWTAIALPTSFKVTPEFVGCVSIPKRKTTAPEQPSNALMSYSIWCVLVRVITPV
jgi:hypothetical protein